MEHGNETDTGIVCRLAHEHLGEALTRSNEVLKRLPRDFHGKVEELAKSVVTNLDSTPQFKNSTSALACIFHKVVDYQVKKKHDQPVSRLEKMTNLDNNQAKRIVCELIKAWCIVHKDFEDDSLDENEVKKYQALVVHLLHYYDRWSSRFFPSDTFCEVLVFVHSKIDDLAAESSSSDRRYVRVLEKMYDASSDLVDNALRVALLAVSDNHAEMEEVIKKKGPLCMKTFRQPRHPENGGLMFWASDLGQVIELALLKADPEACRARHAAPATGSGAAAPSRAAGQQWTVWSASGSTVRATEYSSREAAQQEFDALKCCAVLAGPEGRLDEKTWTKSGMISKVIMEDVSMQELTLRVDQYVALRRAAVAAVRGALAAGGAADGEFGAGSAEGEAWATEVAKVHDRWMLNTAICNMRAAPLLPGVAEAFRGGKKVRWKQGVLEARDCAATLPGIILDVVDKFSELVFSHARIMGALNSMIGKGGCKEALAAIFALRQRCSITGQLAKAMDAFVDAASLQHGVVQRELFKSIEAGGRIKGQSAPMQRLYLESFSAVSKLREQILTEWHQLGLQVADSDIADEFCRIEEGEREAYQQLLSLPVVLPALGAPERGGQFALKNAPAAALQMQPLEDAPSAQATPAPSPRDDAQGPDGRSRPAALGPAAPERQAPAAAADAEAAAVEAGGEEEEPGRAAEKAEDGESAAQEENGGAAAVEAAEAAEASAAPAAQSPLQAWGAKLAKQVTDAKAIATAAGAKAANAAAMQLAEANVAANAAANQLAERVAKAEESQSVSALKERWGRSNTGGELAPAAAAPPAASGAAPGRQDDAAPPPAEVPAGAAPAAAGATLARAEELSDGI